MLNRWSLAKIGQLPLLRDGILPDDVGGVVVAEDLEIAVVRPYPLVLNLFDGHHQRIELDAAGRFIDPVSGIALNPDFHCLTANDPFARYLCCAQNFILDISTPYDRGKIFRTP